MQQVVINVRMRSFLFLLLLSALLCLPARAEDEQNYIIQVEEPIEEKWILDGLEPVYEAAGLYRTGDQSIVDALAAEEALTVCEPDHDVVLFDLQEELETLRGEEWTRAMLGADYAASQGLYGEGVKIALIDSGIRPDFAEQTGAAVAQGVNVLESGEEERKDTSDSIGHGTFAASIIASAAGIAPRAEIIPFKCFDSKHTEVSYVVSAIYTAVDDYHCDIMNLSLGTTDDSLTLRGAIAHAYENGVMMIAASGNLEPGTVTTGDDAPYYPAAYDEVISVGAVSAKKQIARFSVQNQSVWITAPGVNVKGLSRTGTSMLTGSGTSYAAPFVTAAAALAVEADPSLTPAELMGLFRDTAEDVGDEGFDSAYGYGVMNLGLLLARVRNDSTSPVLSLCDGTLCVSVARPGLGTDCELLLARYERSGRFAGVMTLAKSRGLYALNNSPLPEIGEKSFTVFAVEKDTFAPLHVARKQ